MTKIAITGYPITTPVIFDAEPVDGGDYGIDWSQAHHLLRAWQEADSGEGEWLRTFAWHEPVGMFITALAGDGEINIDYWTEQEHKLYHVGGAPFDLTVRELTSEAAWGVALIGGQSAAVADGAALAIRSILAGASAMGTPESKIPDIIDAAISMREELPGL